MWSEASPQAKVFMITHIAATLIEFIGETSLYGLIPDTSSSSIKTRFWAQYLIGLSIHLLIGEVGFTATDCLAKSGWTKTAWVMSILPTITILTGGFIIHGVDTILGTSSGTGGIALIKAAYTSKKIMKKK